MELASKYYELLWVCFAFMLPVLFLIAINITHQTGSFDFISSFFFILFQWNCGVSCFIFLSAKESLVSNLTVIYRKYMKSVIRTLRLRFRAFFSLIWWLLGNNVLFWFFVVIYAHWPCPMNDVQRPYPSPNHQFSRIFFLWIVWSGFQSSWIDEIFIYHSCEFDFKCSPYFLKMSIKSILMMNLAGIHELFLP